LRTAVSRSSRENEMAARCVLYSVVLVALLGISAGAAVLPEHILAQISYVERPILQNHSWAALDGAKLIESNPSSDTFVRTVRLLDYEVADKNSPCGFEAWAELSKLVSGNRLEVIDYLQFDKEGRAVARAIYDGSLDVAEMMVSRGLGTATTDRLKAVQEQAAEEKVGCVWRSALRQEWETTTDKEEDEEWDGQVRITKEGKTSSRYIFTDQWPTGFTTTRITNRAFNRPLDFIFPPGRGGDMIVAENKGIIYYIRNSRVLETPVMDLTPIIASYQDQGLMSIAVADDFAETQRLFVFLVFDHDPRPEAFYGPKSSSVLRTVLNGDTDDISQRRYILGSLHGPGCDGFGPDSDCIPAEGKSHVGGALGFNRRGDLFVGIGDGALAIITPLAHRSQMMNTYSGKILRVNQSGRGKRANPFRIGDNMNSRRNKMFAIGFRNPLHLHVAPRHNGRVYVGDTQWNEEEEANVVNKGDNCGWPCYEGTIKRNEYANVPVCRGKTASDFKMPLVSWAHANSAASMIGPRITIRAWPAYYRNVIVYGDIAANWIGFAKVNGRDQLIDDLHRIRVPAFIVQAREGPDNSLYYSDVRGNGGIYKVSYQEDKSRLLLIDTFPPRGSRGVMPVDGIISNTYSRTLDPRTVEGHVRLVEVRTGRWIPISITHRYIQNTLDIQPDETLLPFTQYRVVSTVGLRTLDYVRPQRLNWAFTTGGNAVPDPPKIISNYPDDGAENIPTGNWISVRFDRAMRVDTLAPNFKIRDAANIDAEIRILRTQYLTTSRTFRVQAQLRPGYTYTATVSGGDAGVRSRESVAMEEDHLHTFSTVPAPDQRLFLNVQEPVQGLSVTRGQSIPYRGSATFGGAAVPDRALRWELRTIHCAYNSDICHDHTTISRRGQSSGSFTAPTHQDKYYYVIVLAVNYGGEQQEASVRVDVNEQNIYLYSDPPGADITINGYTSRAPVDDIKVAINTDIQISAAEAHDGRNFRQWSCGGARTQTFVMTEEIFNCTAIYADNESADARQKEERAGEEVVILA